MVYLSANAPKEDAKQTAGHGLEEWFRFLYFTRDEAVILKKEHPGRTWKDVPFDEKERIRGRVNVLLEAEQIPPVGEDVMRWRMNFCVRDHAKKSHNKPRRASAAQPSKDKEAAAVVTGERARNHTQRTNLRPYDPIRDL